MQTSNQPFHIFDKQTSILTIDTGSLDDFTNESKGVVINVEQNNNSEQLIQKVKQYAVENSLIAESDQVGLLLI